MARCCPLTVVRTELSGTVVKYDAKQIRYSTRQSIRSSRSGYCLQLCVPFYLCEVCEYLHLLLGKEPHVYIYIFLICLKCPVSRLRILPWLSLTHSVPYNSTALRGNAVSSSAD